MAGNHARRQRLVLDGYTIKGINLLITVTTTLTIISMLAYTFDPHTAAHVKSPQVYLTNIFVVFAMLRYLSLAYGRNLGESPVDILLSDKPLIIACLMWAGAYAWLVYG